MSLCSIKLPAIFILIFRDSPLPGCISHLAGEGTLPLLHRTDWDGFRILFLWSTEKGILGDAAVSYREEVIAAGIWCYADITKSVGTKGIVPTDYFLKKVDSAFIWSAGQRIGSVHRTVFAATPVWHWLIFSMPVAVH